MHFYHLLIFFKINFFLKKNQEYLRTDPDQARHFVGPDLGPNCLQRLSTDDTRRQKVNAPIITAADDSL